MHAAVTATGLQLPVIAAIQMAQASRCLDIMIQSKHYSDWSVGDTIPYGVLDTMYIRLVDYLVQNVTKKDSYGGVKRLSKHDTRGPLCAGRADKTMTGHVVVTRSSGKHTTDNVGGCSAIVYSSLNRFFQHCAYHRRGKTALISKSMEKLLNRHSLLFKLLQLWYP